VVLIVLVVLHRHPRVFGRVRHFFFVNAGVVPPISRLLLVSTILFGSFLELLPR
jgi:hypothetical protein